MSNIWNVSANIYYEPWKKLITDDNTTVGITYIGYSVWSVSPALTSEEKRDIYILDKTVSWYDETKRPIDADWKYINTKNLIRDNRASYTYA